MVVNYFMQSTSINNNASDTTKSVRIQASGKTNEYFDFS